MIFAEKVLAPGDVNLNAETRELSSPIPSPRSRRGTSYAVVLLTNSGNYNLRVRNLGQLGQNGVITRQTYAGDVLLWKARDLDAAQRLRSHHEDLRLRLPVQRRGRQPSPACSSAI
ncbi:MAG: hypothetical protein MZV70_52280 [Desulfobacterales bacterium]|nr:hypothetical protein [Desulfobacterales bacterium]